MYTDNMSKCQNHQQQIAIQNSSSSSTSSREKFRGCLEDTGVDALKLPRRRQSTAVALLNKSDTVSSTSSSSCNTSIVSTKSDINGDNNGVNAAAATIAAVDNEITGESSQSEVAGKFLNANIPQHHCLHQEQHDDGDKKEENIRINIHNTKTNIVNRGVDDIDNNVDDDAIDGNNQTRNRNKIVNNNRGVGGNTMALGKAAIAAQEAKTRVGGSSVDTPLSSSTAVTSQSNNNKPPKRMERRRESKGYDFGIENLPQRPKRDNDLYTPSTAAAATTSDTNNNAKNSMDIKESIKNKRNLIRSKIHNPSQTNIQEPPIPKHNNNSSTDKISSSCNKKHTTRQQHQQQQLQKHDSNGDNNDNNDNDPEIMFPPKQMKKDHRTPSTGGPTDAISLDSPDRPSRNNDLTFILPALPNINNIRQGQRRPLQRKNPGLATSAVKKQNDKSNNDDNTTTTTSSNIQGTCSDDDEDLNDYENDNDNKCPIFAAQQEILERMLISPSSFSSSDQQREEEYDDDDVNTNHSYNDNGSGNETAEYCPIYAAQQQILNNMITKCNIHQEEEEDDDNEEDSGEEEEEENGNDSCPIFAAQQEILKNMINGAEEQGYDHNDDDNEEDEADASYYDGNDNDEAIGNNLIFAAQQQILKQMMLSSSHDVLPGDNDNNETGVDDDDDSDNRNNTKSMYLPHKYSPEIGNSDVQEKMGMLDNKGNNSNVGQNTTTKAPPRTIHSSKKKVQFSAVYVGTSTCNISIVSDVTNDTALLSADHSSISPEDELCQEHGKNSQRNTESSSSSSSSATATGTATIKEEESDDLSVIATRPRSDVEDGTIEFGKEKITAPYEPPLLFGDGRKSNSEGIKNANNNKAAFATANNVKATTRLQDLSRSFPAFLSAANANKGTTASHELSRSLPVSTTTTPNNKNEKGKSDKKSKKGRLKSNLKKMFLSP